jgi:hypothetical protein
MKKNADQWHKGALSQIKCSKRQCAEGFGSYSTRTIEHCPLHLNV